MARAGTERQDGGTWLICHDDVFITDAGYGDRPLYQLAKGDRGDNFTARAMMYRRWSHVRNTGRGSRDRGTWLRQKSRDPESHRYGATSAMQEATFRADSLLEEDGFEPPVLFDQLLCDGNAAGGEETVERPPSFG